jgi:uncharacterized protein
MYNLGDKTYLKQPKFMSLETVKAFAGRLQAYSSKSKTDVVHIIFHGGEPLLLEKDYYAACVQILTQTCPDLIFNFSLQTNGVTLNIDWYNFFKEANIKVGVSLDGPKAYHDEFRLFHNGKGSYKEVATAVKLGEHNGLSGILMVINPKIPVDEFYQELKDLGVKRINLLFPDGHYDRLPDGIDPCQHREPGYSPYADWLIALFKIWKQDKKRPVIRLFETLIEMLAGNADRGNQGFGRTRNGVVVIESDGGIEVTDSLRACYEGITKNNYNVHTNCIEDLFDDEIFEVYYDAHDMVAEQCLNCPVFELCGGGFLGNRYANNNGFNNPTIYCKDMVRLITFLRNDFLRSLPQEAVDALMIETLAFEEVMEALSRPPKTKINNDIEYKLISFNQLATI